MTPVSHWNGQLHTVVSATLLVKFRQVAIETLVSYDATNRTPPRITITHEMLSKTLAPRMKQRTIEREALSK
jgi:hypothetical protein